MEQGILLGGRLSEDVYFHLHCKSVIIMCTCKNSMVPQNVECIG